MTDFSNKEDFTRELSKYWQEKGITPLKPPTLGGKEIDFYVLYKSVIERGGAEKVKIWKDLCDELELPKSCTSGAHHLKNHYKKLLLGFELIHFQGKDDTNLPSLENKNARGKRINKEKQVNKENNEKTEVSSESSQSESDDFDDEELENSEEEVVISANINPNNSDVGKELLKMYKNQNKSDQVYYTSKTRCFVTKSDIKRITLAFESKIQDEITYAINSLLLYSVNLQTPFILDQHSGLLDKMTLYLIDSVRNIPNLHNVFKIKISNITNSNEEFQQPVKESQSNLLEQLNVLENYNYPISQIMLRNINNAEVEISPLALLQKREKEQVLNQYEAVSEVYLLEQIRSIFLILRNLCLDQKNEQSIINNKNLCQLLIQLFQYNSDKELSLSILDILSKVSKYIVLSNIPNCERFCLSIFSILNNSEQNIEIESAIEIMANLISIPENVSIIESMTGDYIDSLSRILLSSYGDIQQQSLHFLCYLSNAKLKTKKSLAEQPKLLMRLISLLGKGVKKDNEIVQGMSLYILSNIVTAKDSRIFMLPFKNDLLMVAASQENASGIALEIIEQLTDFELELKL